MAKRIAIHGLAAALAAFASVGLAQERGWYAGGSLGQSRVKFDRGAFEGPFAAAGLGTTGFTFNETDSGWKLFAGYKFNRNFALEGSYRELGEFTASTRVISGSPLAPVNVNFTFKATQGFDLAALGIVPLGRFSVFGKLGGYCIKTEGSGVGVNTATGSDRGTGFLYGLGAQYELAKNLDVRAEWEMFNKVGDKVKTFEGDIGLLSVGLAYKF
jgi:OmpA-OmpF porin, OOP family